MKIQIRSSPFDSWYELAVYKKELEGSSSYGACSSFVGTMRPENQGDPVSMMKLEHYPGMTEKELDIIVNKSFTRHELLDVLMLHRVGVVYPGDDIVLVAVWSLHRKEAFAACRDIIEALKAKAPFWKKETLRDGDRWVERNTPG